MEFIKKGQKSGQVQYILRRIRKTLRLRKKRKGALKKTNKLDQRLLGLLEEKKKKFVIPSPRSEEMATLFLKKMRERGQSKQGKEGVPSNSQKNVPTRKERAYLIDDFREVNYIR